MNSLLQDLRYGARLLRTQPGFTPNAVLSLSDGAKWQIGGVARDGKYGWDAQREQPPSPPPVIAFLNDLWTQFTVEHLSLVIGHLLFVIALKRSALLALTNNK